jgi:hypothetical protein
MAKTRKTTNPSQTRTAGDTEASGELAAASLIYVPPLLFSRCPKHSVFQQGLIFRQVVGAGVVAEGEADDFGFWVLHDEDLGKALPLLGLVASAITSMGFAAWSGV